MEQSQAGSQEAHVYRQVLWHLCLCRYPVGDHESDTSLGTAISRQDWKARAEWRPSTTHHTHDPTLPQIQDPVWDAAKVLVASARAASVLSPCPCRFGSLYGKTSRATNVPKAALLYHSIAARPINQQLLFSCFMAYTECQGIHTPIGRPSFYPESSPPSLFFNGLRMLR